MNMLRFRLLPLLAIVGLVVTLGGCPLQPEAAPDTRFYVLGSVPADAPILAGARRNPPMVIDLASLRLPQYLQRTQIVTRVDENRLSLSEYDQWGGNLEKNMLRVIATNLGRLLGTPDVHIAARRTPTGVSAQVEIEVMQFERGPDGRAVLSAQWRLLGDREDETLLSKVTNLASEPLGADGNMATTVAAMTALIAEFSRQIAAAIIATDARA
jgi:uncharacterized protein